jgi:hypothetical protein
LWDDVVPELKKEIHDWPLRWSIKILVSLLFCAACFTSAHAARDKSLEEKLSAMTDYVPQAEAPLDKLIEVAQKFNLPMAIEWMEGAKPVNPEKKPGARKRSVKELLEEITRVTPEHRVEVENGLVRVYSQQAAEHPFNFLNIVVDSYQIKDGDLFDAEDRLRWAIRFTLEPEKYRNGYGGGYGHTPGDVFEFPKFTLSATNTTIRGLLNRIALAQGNALWVAEIRNDDLQGPEPFWKKGADEDDEGNDRPVTSAWHFYPLWEIPELAKEQLAVDVRIEGMIDQRMSTIPVILEHGISADAGGNMGIGSSDGYSVGYSASVEKIEKETITLTVNLTVRRKAEAERKFTEQLEVRRGQVTERQPERGISIRAYIEPRTENK